MKYITILAKVIQIIGVKNNRDGEYPKTKIQLIIQQLRRQLNISGKQYNNLSNQVHQFVIKNEKIKITPTDIIISFNYNLNFIHSIFIIQQNKMNMLDQCNLLKGLYQRKYYQGSLRQNVKQSNMLKMKVNECRERKQEYGYKGCNKQSAPQLKLPIKQKGYNFEYCNEPIAKKFVSYRQFVVSKDRKSKSVSCARQVSNNKQNNWIQELKQSTLHSTRSYYINILGLRTRKYKAQKTLDAHVLKSQQNTAREYPKPAIPASRNTISEARKRTTFTVLRNRQTNKTHHEAKRDDNQLLPWHVDADELII